MRSFLKVGSSPLIARSAQGARLETVDGKSVIDFVMSYGPHLFGHAYAPLVHTAQEVSKKGFCFGLTSEKEIEWGEIFLSFLPHDWRVRAMSTGTEACMTAARLARGFTGREIILKCSGHYHGHSDLFLFDAGSGVATLGDQKAVADSAGIPKALAETIKIIPFNDIEKLKTVFEQYGPQIAGFILEPVMGNMGVVLPEKSFLERARELCSKNGALLIFDEVMTGFRVAMNSAAGKFGVRPDLATYGKIVGGGFPLAALTGPKSVLDSLAPIGKVYQAGTLSGNPMACAVGTCMLNEIKNQNPYQALDDFASELKDLITQVGRQREIPLTAVNCGSMVSVHFCAKAPRNASEVQNIDRERFTKFFHGALANGLMLPPSPFEAFFLSTAHLEVKQDIFKSLEMTLKEI